MIADQPYVARRIVDVDAATSAASTATQRWGLPAPELVRVGMNAIFRAGDAAIRVGHATARAAAAHALAEVMLDAEVAVARPVEAHCLDLAGVAVTAWEWLESVDAPIDWVGVGRAVARIHRLDLGEVPGDYPLPSPERFPWWDFERLLAEVAGDLDATALAGLRDAIDSSRSWAEAIGVGAVLCHGDVHPGNVVMTERGATLIDFDLLCTAAPAWDHAMLTTYADRWGGAREAYEQFADGYGRSFADDELTATIATLRNVAATLMRVRAGRTDPSARAEAERRLRYWRGDADAPAWRAQ